MHDFGNQQGQEVENKQSFRAITFHSSLLIPQTFTLRTESLQMEILLSAVLGEVATRSMSFLINRCSMPPVLAVEVSLERILLRAQVIVDEAMGRHITNQGMLRQLNMLRDMMYRGCYVLDTFRYQSHEEDEGKNQQAVNHSWALSKFSYAKRLCLSSSSSSSPRTLQELEEALDDLNTMIRDVSELVVFLRGYPRLCRQPYSMHLLLDKCMFGRQMEMELVINFLLYTQPCSSNLDSFDILPIVGPGRVGKSTLVTHVCDDKRVRDHFSQIVFLRHSNFRDEEIATLRDGCAMRHENNGRLLVVVEVGGDLNEDMWESLCSLSRWCTTSGSKIIITSQSDSITKLGTTQALSLKHLSDEAYWYFFKVITFGSMDPDLHPKLAYLAMEIARLLNGCVVAANIVARLLRANFGVHFWCKFLKYTRGYIEKHRCMFGEHPCHLLNGCKPTYIRRLGRTSEDLFVFDQYQMFSSQGGVPEITLHDVVFGGVKPHGTFKVIAWKSQIPPYHLFIYTCKIRELQTRVVKRKHSLNSNGITHG